MKNVWYKVHKNTKVHEILCDEAVWSINKGFCVSLFGYDLIKADGDGWIEWKGGECPLPDNHPYEAKCTNRRVYLGNPQSNRARIKRWGGVPNGYEIIAYRPILNAEETEMKQEWSGEGMPPAGWHGEILIGGFNNWSECVVLPCNCLAIKPLFSDWSQSVVREIGSADKLRAIQADRDRWIEAARKAVIEADFTADAYEAIYDAGLAKLPEQK